MRIHELKAPKRASRRRVGRGGTRGTTSGRGTKGQKSRSGGKGVRRGFEGGRTSLIQQLPKNRGKGFSRVRPAFKAVNVQALDKCFEDGATVDPSLMLDARLVRRKDRFLKILGSGIISKKLKVSAHAFSDSAKEKIEKAGGTVIVLPMPEHKGAKPKEERVSKK